MTVPAVGPRARARDRAPPRAARRPRSRWPSPASPSRRHRPGRGGPRRARPGGRIRVDANGGWDVDQAARMLGACAGSGWSTPSSRAPRWTTWPRCAGWSTCRWPRTSRSAGPTDPLRSAAAGAADIVVLKVAAARRRGGRAASRRGVRAAGRGVQRGGVLGRPGRRGRAGRRAARAAVRLRAGHDARCSTGDVTADPLLPVGRRAAGAARRCRTGRAGRWEADPAPWRARMAAAAAAARRPRRRLTGAQ